MKGMVMKIGKVGFLVGLFCLSFSPGYSQVFDIVVDANGTGNYTTVQAALDAVADNNADRTLIFVKSGLYNEKVHLEATKKNVSIIGENVESVIIDWDDYQGKNGLSGADSYTFLAEGDDLYMENITIRNSAGQVGQAVALRTIGDRQAFKNCRMLGNQDTYYAHKRRQYNYKCTVEGTTDFIYGDATSVYDSCIIRSVPGGSYITAPADTKLITQFSSGPFYHGLLFRYCDVTAAEGVSANSVYLGRPWQPNSSTVYIKCTLGDHIRPEGWSEWNDNNHLSSVFAEFENKTPEGELVDTTQRVDWSYQLEESRVNTRYALDFFLNSINNNQLQDWDPVPAVTPLKHPENAALNNNELSWDAVDNAKGYVVYYQGAFLQATESTSISVSGNNLENYKVLSVDDNGAISDGSVSSTTSVHSHLKEEIRFTFKDRRLQLKEPADIQVFDMFGKEIISGTKENTVSFSNLPAGMFLVVARNKEGKRGSIKIINH